MLRQINPPVDCDNLVIDTGNGPGPPGGTPIEHWEPEPAGEAAATID